MFVNIVVINNLPEERNERTNGEKFQMSPFYKDEKIKKTQGKCQGRWCG